MPNFPTYDFLMLQLKLKGIWQRRSLGQHFLVDAGLLEAIATLTGAGTQTLAVEIGPGPGTLTSQLGARAGHVLAVEFDTRLAPLHQDAFGTFPSIEFIYDDALKVDLAAEARSQMAQHQLTDAVLTGNLPFQITSPLLFDQCGPDVPWRGITVMIQREVADRICAHPNTKDYGILTVKLAYWWRVTERVEVPAASFFPRPQVDASVLNFARQPESEQPTPEEWPGLSSFIDAAFAQRRKMLYNSLAARWPHFPGKEPFLATLAALGIPEKVRAENLSVAQFRTLYHALSNHS